MLTQAHSPYHTCDQLHAFKRQLMRARVTEKLLVTGLSSLPWHGGWGLGGDRVNQILKISSYSSIKSNFPMVELDPGIKICKCSQVQIVNHSPYYHKQKRIMTQQSNVQHCFTGYMTQEIRNDLDLYISIYCNIGLIII